MEDEQVSTIQAQEDLGKNLNIMSKYTNYNTKGKMCTTKVIYREK